MFDLGWVETLFIVALAIVIIGPKDLPQLFKALRGVHRQVKKLIANVKSTVTSLENEIDGGRKPTEGWRDLVPEHLRHLDKDFSPGDLRHPQTDHRERRQAYDDIREAHEDSSNRREKEVQPPDRNDQ